jgi:hypothetical protein
MGASNLPSLEILDYEQTAERQDAKPEAKPVVKETVIVAAQAGEITADNLRLDNNDFSNFALEFGPAKDVDAMSEVDKHALAAAHARLALGSLSFEFTDEEKEDCFETLRRLQKSA